jgi:acetate CoA/acetoacetate CoA-transferase beta subunit
MKMIDVKERIARRIALEMQDGDIVNLGIGLPTMVPKYLPEDVHIILHSENGFVGLGPLTGDVQPDLVDAGGKPTGVVPGAAMFDSAMSFALIRGGHINVTVLGALQVDQGGNLANWMIPGKMVPGMGGAMDLVAGAKTVIIAMEHTAKDGSSKILKKCTLPLTGQGVVSTIVTELAVFRIIANELVLEEIAPGLDVAAVKARTGAEFTVSENLAVMKE